MPPRSLAKPRMVIEITKEQKDKLNNYLAYGEQRRVFSTILEDVINMLDEFGHAFVSFILEREFSYRIYMREYCENRRSGNSTLNNHDIQSATRIDSPSTQSSPNST